MNTKKTCIDCNQEKPEKRFRRGERFCSACSKQRQRRATKKVLWEILSRSKCKDCGEPDPVVLQFDHRDPSKKTADVNTLMKNAQTAKMLVEIEKCDIVCANCHTRRTAAMFGNWRVGRAAAA